MDEKLTKAVIGGATVLWVLLGGLGVLPALFSCMMFDAPGSENNWATIALAYSLMSFPFSCFISVAKSRENLRDNGFTVALLWAMLPLVNLGVGGMGFTWISLFQGGKFHG